jgi:hypothetical protein
VYIVNGMNPSGAHHDGDRKSVGIKGVVHPLDKPEGNTRKPLDGLGTDVETIKRMCASFAAARTLLYSPRWSRLCIAGWSRSRRAVRY